MANYIRIWEHVWDAAADVDECLKIENFFSLIRAGKTQELQAHIHKHPESVLYTNNLRENALHIAAKAQQPAILKIILSSLPKKLPQEGIKDFINQRDSEGFSPLMVCAVQKSTDCARLLMPYHPNLRIEGYDIQRNVMHLAAEHDADEILRMVLSEKDPKGEPILNPNQLCKNSSKKFGYRSIHLAASNRAEKAVAVLIEFGADINTTTTQNSQSFGQTPLMMALEKRCFNMANLFLGNPKCDLTIKDSRGNLAYHYAKHYGFQKDFLSALKKQTINQLNVVKVSKHDDKQPSGIQHTIV